MTSPKHRWGNLALLSGALGFSLLGQYYLFYRRLYLWDALIFLGVGLGCFIWLSHRVGVRPFPAHPAPSTARSARLSRLAARPRLWLGGAAVLLNYLAARAANTQPPPHDFTLSVALWPASPALLTLAVVRPSLSFHRPSRPRIAAAVLLLLLVGFLLRAWDLENIPRNLGGDEGTQGMWAVDVLEGRLRNPFGTGWFSVPTMSFFAQAASLRLFGDSIAGLRMLSALLGTATLALTYLLARQMFGRRVGLFALAALTFNHFHIHFSRLGSNQIADPFFATLTFWLLLKGLRQRPAPAGLRQRPAPAGLRQHPAPPQPATPYWLHEVHRGWFLAAGLAMGLSWYGYFGARAILVMVAAYLGTRVLLERGFWKRHARSLALMGLAAWMAASPLLIYYAHHPETMTARWNQVSFFTWLEAELSRPGHASVAALVWRQIWRSISAFNYTLDPTFWYRAQIPMLDLISGFLFLLGLCVAIARWRKKATQLLLLWFGLALTLGWVLTENPPSSMRMVIITPAVAILVALGLDRLSLLGRRVLGGGRRAWQVGVGLLILSIALYNTYYYFFIYTPRRIYGNPTAETATVLARYLASRDDQPQVYLYGPPFLYFDFGTIRFIARDVQGVNVPPRDQEPNPSTPLGDSTLFIVLRERLDELADLHTRYPNGSVREFYSPADQRLMFVVYQVPP